jgi:microcin C transport system ATP-binding protein
MLTVSRLRYSFYTDDGLREVLKGVSFRVGDGKTLALVGESGSGKSVTAQSILRLHDPRTAVQTAGDIRFNNEAISSRSVMQLRKQSVGMIFQEPMVSLNPLQRVGKQIGERWEISNPDRQEESEKRALNWLTRVGLRSPQSKMHAYPHQLSGGERQRVMIAMALITEPELLIADEPTTALDVNIQAQILRLLADIKAELGMSMLFITHDLNIVRQLADTVAVMRDGEIVEKGSVNRIFNHAKHPYTQMLIAAEPDPLPEKLPSAETILEVEDLKVWFPITAGIFKKVVDHVKAVDGVSFRIAKGSCVGIVGESGCGKTTMALSLLGIVDGTGKAEFAGVNLLALNHKQMQPYRADIQMIFQDPFSALSPRLNVAEIIAEGLLVHTKLDDVETVQRVVSVMEKVGLDPETRFRYPMQFSGGQRQRIAIARALILEPKLIILDEPTSSLDRSVQKQILSLLRTLQTELGISYVLITHDLAVVRAMCHSTVVMQAGKVVEISETQQLFADPQSEYTKKLFAAEIRKYGE